MIAHLMAWYDAAPVWLQLAIAGVLVAVLLLGLEAADRATKGRTT